MRVLVVEDDDEIAGPLRRGLEREGFETEHVTTGTGALDVFRLRPFDLVLLDLGLPDIDGYEVCRRLRAVSGVPVIMLTARGEEIDRVVGLEIGADDYVVKPFGLRELIARIRAVTRRTANPGAPAAEAAPSIRVGELSIDFRTHKAELAGAPLELTPKEYDLLVFLARDAGAVRTRSEIIDNVWDPHWYGPTKTLDVHVASLRKKLGDPAWIETVRSVGFRLRAF